MKKIINFILIFTSSFILVSCSNKNNNTEFLIINDTLSYIDESGRIVELINLNDLIGAKGEDGVNGTNGINGVDGVDGLTPYFQIHDDFLLLKYVNSDQEIELLDLRLLKGEDGKSPSKIESSYINEEGVLIFQLNNGEIINSGKINFNIFIDEVKKDILGYNFAEPSMIFPKTLNGINFVKSDDMYILNGKPISTRYVDFEVGLERFKGKKLLYPCIITEITIIILDQRYTTMITI